MQDSIASAPMTELLTFTDSLGRIIAKAGRASESTDFNFVKFVRDESGEITLLETFVLDENEVNNKGHLSHLAKEYIFGLRPKPGHTHRFQLIKDYTGHVIEVIDIGQQSVMTAPKGYAIEYSVEEGPGFWSSCTEGGRFFITFHVKPIDI